MKLSTNSILILSLICFYHQTAQAAYHAEDLVAHGEICHGSADDLAQLSLYEMPSTPTGKCMLTCMAKDVKMLDEHGKYDKANVENFLLHRWSEHKEHANDIAQKCYEQTKDRELNDKCEYGYDVVICMVNLMREKQFFTSLHAKSKELHEKLKGGYKISEEVKQRVKETVEKYRQTV